MLKLILAQILLPREYRETYAVILGVRQVFAQPADLRT